MTPRQESDRSGPIHGSGRASALTSPRPEPRYALNHGINLSGTALSPSRKLSTNSSQARAQVRCAGSTMVAHAVSARRRPTPFTGGGSRHRSDGGLRRATDRRGQKAKGTSAHCISTNLREFSAPAVVHQGHVDILAPGVTEWRAARWIQGHQRADLVKLGGSWGKVVVRGSGTTLDLAQRQAPQCGSNGRNDLCRRGSDNGPRRWRSGWASRSK